MREFVLLNHSPLLVFAFHLNAAVDNYCSTGWDVAKPGDGLLSLARGQHDVSLCGEIMSTYAKAAALPVSL